ncbi:RNase H domain-containing protein [Trichonephila clavipes]|nr:RNase H domain-containing protein [Trichonephila clavipes]
MSVLEALENYNDRCHSVVCKILDITSGLYSKGLDIMFCWLPSHVGIIGKEQADSAAKSATTHLPLVVPLSDMKRVIMHHIFTIWQESWSQQLDNKLNSVKPVIGAWPVMPMRRTDVKLTRLRIGHTCFIHRHLLLGEDAPECPSCKFVKINSRNRRKRPKVEKPDIEIKMASHRKAAPTEITTVDEDMITYNVEEEKLEQDPLNVFTFNPLSG